jgi:integrase
MLKEQSRIPEALSDSELESLIAACSERTQQVVITAADTGMRRSEIQRLTWRDVDFEAGTVIVRWSKNKDYRVIPMTNRVRSLLAHLQPALMQPDQPVIPFGDIKRSLHSAGMRAQVGHVHLHQLRHTFATRLRDRGVPLDRIMELMGHKSMDYVAARVMLPSRPLPLE